VIGEQISHYRIVERLGAGGMGVVWKAEDLTLGRMVALKFLAPEMARDPQALDRFMREARAAAALNHPNICQVYEAATADGHTFIAMELLEGQTLEERLDGRPVRLNQLLDWCSQVTDAMEAAHARGIVHRDIKPANLFLTTRNVVKVLDFGLAKLAAAKQFTALTTLGNAPTSDHMTEAGTTPGTVAYMSPEQIGGEELDGRSDIFALGVVMYEMATGKLPFHGNTPAATFGAILHKEPAPLTSLNTELPPELNRIVFKALEKDRDLRYQSAAELRADLKRLKRETESGNQRTSAFPVADTSTAIGRPMAKRRSKFLYLAGGLLVLVITAAIAAWLFFGSSSNFYSRLSVQDISMSRMTSGGRAALAAISPDGRYVVYVKREGDNQSLWLRQTATTSNVQILPPTNVGYVGLTFSLDGNFIYYISREHNAGQNDLYVMPVLGGPARKLVSDIDSAIGFSPDGRQMAFYRIQNRTGTRLLVADADGHDEKVIGKTDTLFQGSPAWSPDGKIIALASENWEDGYRTEIIGYPVAGGTPISLSSHRFFNAGQTAWLPDGTGLVINASDSGPASPRQLWIARYPGGETRKLTNDLNDYDTLSMTADGKSLVTVVYENRTSLWELPASGGNATQASVTDLHAATDGFALFPDGRMLYDSVQPDSIELWVCNPDGSNAHPVITGFHFAIHPAIAPDGQSFVFVAEKNKGVHLWRANADGGNQQELTSGSLDLLPLISNDQHWIYYSAIGHDDIRVMRVPFAGGKPEVIGNPEMDRAAATVFSISPDGTEMAYPDMDPATRQIGLIIAKLPDGAKERSLPIPGTVRWSADGRTLIYAKTVNGVTNLWSMPVEGGKPVQLTNFTADRIRDFSLSADGKRLGVVRMTTNSDVVLITLTR
jgi:serine/threonine protein kinase